MVGAVRTAQAQTGEGFNFKVKGKEFLQLFLAELKNQNPLEPLSNTEMMDQIARITNVQTMGDLSKAIGRLAGENPVLQAGNLLDRTVEYTGADGLPATSVVRSVAPDSDGGVVLGLANGSAVPMDAVIRLSS